MVFPVSLDLFFWLAKRSLYIAFAYFWCMDAGISIVFVSQVVHIPGIFVFAACKGTAESTPFAFCPPQRVPLTWHNLDGTVL